MKNKNVTSSIVLVATICIALLAAFFGGSKRSEANVVQGKQDAIEIARIAIAEKFGSEEAGKPLVAEYDTGSETWMVQGTLSEENGPVMIDGEPHYQVVLGGTPCVIISGKSGEVVSIGHGL